MIDDCFETIRTTPVDSSGQVFHVQTPYGGGNVTLDNALALRAGGMAMAVSGPDPHTPQPGTPAIGDESEVPKFTFFIYDHLGNSRILYTTQLVDCNSDSTKYLLEHVLDYYPYGRTLREYVFNRERFQTTYHERDQETGLDYRGARFYDGDVGRFLSVDPLAEKYASWSTYHYTLNNPILFVDPDGRSVESTHIDGVGNVIAEYDDGDNGVYVHATGTTKAQIDVQRGGGAYTGGDGNYIGAIGGTVNIDGVFDAMLAQNAEVANGVTTLNGYKELVRTNGDWDLKNTDGKGGRPHTVFGVAWTHAAKNSGEFTEFTFKGLTFEDASDVGNYHAGYMGRLLDGGKGFNRALLYAGAGAAETWKDLKNFELWNVYSQSIDLIFATPPYGDEADDHIWNKRGMDDADATKN